MAQVLDQKYPPFDDLVSRLASVLVTEKDLKDFHQMIAQIFETGFLVAVEEYKKKLEEAGVRVSLGYDNQLNSGQYSVGTARTS